MSGEDGVKYAHAENIENVLCRSRQEWLQLH